MTETVAEILAAYRSGAMTPADLVARSYARIRAHDDPAIFITLRNEEDVAAEARALMRGGDKSLPLYGIPVAVKDNIDVGGLPTTAACPAYLYQARKDATAVARLRAAGALILGKTNLDQFATGLVGVRSPYGVPRNLFDAKLIPGGSSSGSGVAVGAGIVPLALGTDTAGSGRVPAMFNNIVGLKPSLGLVSTAGVVPACRSLDCVSVFALTVDDAVTALNVIAAPDSADPFSRSRPMHAVGPMPDGLKLGIPLADQRLFFGDKISAAAYDAALTRFADLGAKIVEVDLEPFYAAARLLYEGPWVAERYLTAKDLLATSPDSILPVTRQIIASGETATAADAFVAFYKLEEFRRIRDETFRAIDALVLPTAPTIYRVDEVAADPITLNSRLGTYTNFVNLLDLCGLAVPASIGTNGLPFGITLLAPGGEDAALAAIGRQFHQATGLQLGALKAPQPPFVKFRLGRRGRARSPSRSSARICPACRSTANCAPAVRACSKAQRPPRITGSSRSEEPCRRSRVCFASRTARARRSSLKSGRCRTRPSVVSSQIFRRRSPSARSNSPTAAASKDFWSRPKPSRARAIFPVLAAGGSLSPRSFVSVPQPHRRRTSRCNSLRFADRI